MRRKRPRGALGVGLGACPGQPARESLAGGSCQGSWVQEQCPFGLRGAARNPGIIEWGSPTEYPEGDQKEDEKWCSVAC